MVDQEWLGGVRAPNHKASEVYDGEEGLGKDRQAERKEGTKDFTTRSLCVLGSTFPQENPILSLATFFV